MMRLIVMALLVGLVITGIVILVTSVQSLTQPASGPAPRKKEDMMPATIRTFAYVILLLLMFGTVTGWLGAV